MGLSGFRVRGEIGCKFDRQFHLRACVVRVLLSFEAE